MRPLLLLGRRTSGIGIWSGAGSGHQMDISSNTQKVHGRILRANPVTISHVLGVPHYYWGVGQPEWVSGTTPTTAPCSPSGWQCYLYVGYRTTLAQSPNQCQIDWWLNDTFLLSRKQINCTCCYLNTHNYLWELPREVHFPQHTDYAPHSIQIMGSITQITPVRFTYIWVYSPDSNHINCSFYITNESWICLIFTRKVHCLSRFSLITD